MHEHRHRLPPCMMTDLQIETAARNRAGWRGRRRRRKRGGGGGGRGGKKEKRRQDGVGGGGGGEGGGTKAHTPSSS